MLSWQQNLRLYCKATSHTKPTSLVAKVLLGFRRNRSHLGSITAQVANILNLDLIYFILCNMSFKMICLQYPVVVFCSYYVCFCLYVNEFI